MLSFALTLALSFSQPPAPEPVEVPSASGGSPRAAQGPAQPGGDQSYRSTSNGDGKGDLGLTILDPEVYDQGQEQSLLPEYHVVAPGDTMWGLTGKYYRDPYQWPLIWSINEQISNAHWIFPGDRLRVREGDGRGRLANAGQGRSGVRYVPASAPQAAPKSYLVQRSFFLFDEEEDKIGKVVGASKPSVMLAEGDVLYLSYDKDNPPLPGERLAVYQPAQTVRDYRSNGFGGRPRKGKKLAKIVQIAAEVQVERLDEKSAAVTVVDSMRPVERGMWVGPLQPRFERMRQEKATVNREGRVVSCIDGYGMSGQRQFVVLNLGEASGARPGNVVTVVRHGDAYSPVNRRNAKDDRGHPQRLLASLVVVQTSQKASLAMVVDSKREILPGDPVILSPAKTAAVPPSAARVSGSSDAR